MDKMAYHEKPMIPHLYNYDSHSECMSATERHGLWHLIVLTKWLTFFLDSNCASGSGTCNCPNSRRSTCCFFRVVGLRLGYCPFDK